MSDQQKEMNTTPANYNTITSGRVHRENNLNAESHTGTTVIAILSGFLQIISGALAISISILGWVNSGLLAAVILLIGCITFFLGVYTSYSVLGNVHTSNALINEAIHRVVTFKN
ncbi:hypothetical protein [Balneola vulgaris]|uniref:hypothetical protein n=1 Tax=Balneola vulgaris TaxID=287535 RepID=UPI000376F931|nr:hypothetical protein [Balneola vulgaris]